MRRSGIAPRRLKTSSVRGAQLPLESAHEQRLRSVGRFARCLHRPQGFQTSQTLPTNAGPGFSVVCPGCQPEGVTSPVLRTCWKAFT